MSQDLLDQRYGVRPPPSRWRLRVAAAVLLVAGLGWVAWVAIDQADQPLSYQLHSYDVVSDSRTDVTVEIDRSEGQAAECDVYAQALDHSTVGEKTITIPAGDPGTVMVQDSLATERRAVNGVLSTCRLLD